MSWVKFENKNFNISYYKAFLTSMLNQNPKPYFNQVTMIESQYESKRRNLTNSNNSSLLQNKSPLRERESTPHSYPRHQQHQHTLSIAASKRK